MDSDGRSRWMLDATDAASWLAGRNSPCLSVEVTLSRPDAPSEVRLQVIHADGEIQAVATATPRGSVFVDAISPASMCRALDAIAVETDVRFVCDSELQGELLAWLARRSARPVRHGALLVMQSERRRTPAEGRWATEADLPRLEEYRRAYDRERGVSSRHDYRAMIGRREIAVLDRDQHVVAVALESDRAPSFACIGGIYVFPEYRRSGLAELLTSWLCNSCLDTRASIKLLVDIDNLAAIALYDKLGFRRVGACCIAYQTT